MNEYVVYFEIFDKKLKTTLNANSIDEAKKKVYDNLKFSKIDEKPRFDKQKKDAEAWRDILKIAIEINKILVGK